MIDPNQNRTAMGSRAANAIKPKFGVGAVPAPTRQGTAGRVTLLTLRISTQSEEWGPP